MCVLGELALDLGKDAGVGGRASTPMRKGASHGCHAAISFGTGGPFFFKLVEPPPRQFFARPALRLTRFHVSTTTLIFLVLAQSNLDDASSCPASVHPPTCA